jgi:hypothetical protein
MNGTSHEVTNRRRVWIPYPAAVMVYVVAVLLAAATLIVEFGLRDGWDFARVYSHLFLYPLVLSSSPGRLLARGPLQSRTRRFPPSGSSAEVTHGVGLPNADRNARPGKRETFQ